MLSSSSIQRLAAMPLLSAGLFTFASENIATTPEREASVEASPPAFTIALSPSGEASNKAKQLLNDLDLLRRSTAGNENAQRSWERLSAERQVGALARALEGGHETLRRRAVKELPEAFTAELNDEARRTAVRALVQAAVRDTIDDVRGKARRAWEDQARGEGAEAKRAIREMGEGLDLKNPIEKRRAFEALKGVGGRGVLEVLITKTTTRWGKGPRGHIMIARQRSYIADYDVSGAVFDPVIRSFIVGVVLDTRALAIEMIHYVIEEIRRLGASEAVQKDPELWADFVKRKRAEAEK